MNTINLIRKKLIAQIDEKMNEYKAEVKQQDEKWNHLDKKIKLYDELHK